MAVKGLNVATGYRDRVYDRFKEIQPRPVILDCDPNT